MYICVCVRSYVLRVEESKIENSRNGICDRARWRELSRLCSLPRHVGIVPLFKAWLLNFVMTERRSFTRKMRNRKGSNNWHAQFLLVTRVVRRDPFSFFYSQFLKIGFLCNRNISSQKTRCIYFGARHSARVRVSPVEFHRLVNKTLMQTRPRTNTCSQWAARVACFNTHSHCTWHSDKSCYVQEFFISYESYELIGWGESMEGHQKPC